MIADDHPLLRTGLRRVLEMAGGLTVVGEAGDAVEAVARAEALRPDVVVLDVQMPGGGGPVAARRIRARDPRTGILALTVMDDEAAVVEMLQAGARGYVLKDADPTQVVEAVRRVAAGGTYVSPELMPGLVRALQGGVGRGTEGDAVSQAQLSGAAMPPGGGPAGAPPGRTGGGQGVEPDLTDREWEILTLIVEGLSNAEIAGRLFLSEKTVKNHITRLLRKLGVRDRTQAAVHALSRGLVRPDARRGG